ncbi:ureidoacrylate peracid hydrolase [Paenibacillus sp. LBL]|uniref:cysteine hydrolase family protein n=1 Tax=Paenibacillus sp. LBL TaxID=2940563 RepID=UPI00247583A6|nr:isochorismatase family cysteine hydrolase [Paenibacillus sp. LBL]MDH6672998.1 ureidoacrylate peracid hydrolase [Paenibacillus sp. LBL]
MKSLNQLMLESKAAVIVVDVQNDYCHPEGALPRAGCDVSGVGEMMPKLHKLLQSAREFHVPVIFIQTLHEKATDSDAWTTRSSGRSAHVCRRGSWGAEFYEVAPEQDDIIVNKHRYSAFVNTRLDSVLKTLKIETLIMTGVSTNVCVESTARDGFMLDYHIVLVADACASYSQSAHDMTLENIEGYFGKVSGVQHVIDIWMDKIPDGSVRPMSAAQTTAR